MILANLIFIFGVFKELFAGGNELSLFTFIFGVFEEIFTGSKQ